MASKKKTYAQGEMRPLSAFAKQGSSSPKKRNTPTRVPEPQKLPQYGVPQANAEAQKQAAAAPMQSINLDVSNIEDAADKLFKSVKELENMKNADASSVQTKPEPLPAAASVTEQIPEPFPEQKPVPKTEIKPEQKPVRVPVQKASDTAVPFTKPGLKPLTEYKQDNERPVPARRRGSAAPDLFNKAERDAYFSKYTSSPEKKPREKYPEITDEYIRMQEPVQKAKEESKSSKRVNPFLTARTGRPVVSHAKEEPAELPIGAKPAAEPEKSSLDEIEEMLRKNTSGVSYASEAASESKPDSEAAVQIAENMSMADDMAASEMRENIEGAIMLQKKEREEAAKARQDSEEFSAARKKINIVRAAGIMGVVVLCGAIMLFGERSDLKKMEDRQHASMPEFSWGTYLNGEYTEGISAYYSEAAPMRGTFEKMAESILKLKGFSSDSTEDSAPADDKSAEEENKQDKGSEEASEEKTTE